MSPTKFAILVPAFHVQDYIARALDSALAQDYPDFRILVAEDHGADGTLSTVITYAHKHPERISYTSNVERRGALANHVAMLGRCEPDEVAVCLDGDDQLAHPGVLTHLAALYARPEVWMTYGSYAYDLESRDPRGDGSGICRALPPDMHDRRAGWMASHLKTFRVWLFRQVKDDDLRFHGEYIDAAPDVALMMPMLEMAGPEHARFVSEVLYLYNGRNPLNEAKVKPSWIRVMMHELMQRRIYPRLERRPA